MCKLFITVGFLATLVILPSCGSEDLTSNRPMKSGIVNDLDLAQLASLLAKNPELTSTSMAEIKELAQASNPRVFKLVEPQVATEAYDSIENILEDLDLSAQVEAAIKIMGVGFNTKGELFNDFDLAGLPIELVANQDIFKLITCEEYMTNPTPGLTQNTINDMINKSEQDFKEIITSCDSLAAGKFLSCLKDINLITKTINQQVSCTTRTKADLDNLIEASIGQNFTEAMAASEDCMINYFGECGFDVE